MAGRKIQPKLPPTPPFPTSSAPLTHRGIATTGSEPTPLPTAQTTNAPPPLPTGSTPTSITEATTPSAGHPSAASTTSRSNTPSAGQHRSADFSGNGMTDMGPLVSKSPSSWRRPTGGDTRSRRGPTANCSGPLGDTGPFWDFTAACETHDYGYDLVRFGVGNRAQADALLYRDMLTSCRGQWLSGVVACRGVVEWARVVLEVGDGLGFDPTQKAGKAR